MNIILVNCGIKAAAQRVKFMRERRGAHGHCHRLGHARRGANRVLKTAEASARQQRVPGLTVWLAEESSSLFYSLDRGKGEETSRWKTRTVYAS